jgi:iron complex outermembrane receptor protein
MNYVSGYTETGVDVTGDPSPVTGCLYSNAAGNPLPAGCQVGDFIDFDLTGSYQLNDHIELHADILNLFDASPPLDPADYAGGGANYNPTYSQAGIIGRHFRLGIHVKY